MYIVHTYVYIKLCNENRRIYLKMYFSVYKSKLSHLSTLLKISNPFCTFAIKTRCLLLCLHIGGRIRIQTPIVQYLTLCSMHRRAYFVRESDEFKIRKNQALFCIPDVIIVLLKHSFFYHKLAKACKYQKPLTSFLAIF